MNANEMIRRILAPVLSVALASASGPAFNAADYVGHVKYLASDELKGRGDGSPELDKAADYIAKEFRSFGLKPVHGRSYFQDFQITTNARVGDKNRLVESVNGEKKALDAKRDFIPFNFSSSGSGPESGLVFAGYGITAPEYNYDDYAGLDVKGKYVLIFRHEPQEFEETSPFAGKNFTSHAQFAAKAVNAKMHGAAGVLLVNDAATHPTDQDQFEKFGATAGPDNAGILFVQVAGDDAARWLRAAGKNAKDLIFMIDHNLKPQSFAFPDAVKIRLDVDIERKLATVHNVAAYLEGETDEYVILGAHYDHLGLGDQYSLAPAEIGSVHHGADDNASGTAGVIELARYFAKQPKQRRGVLFLAFAGEELGLLGSSWYVNHPDLSLAKAVAMINMDMIGRMRDSKIYLSGAGTGTTLQKTVSEAGKRDGITLDLSEKAGYGASDHTSFTSKQVPVLFFFSGLHADYHKPSDTWDKIDGTSATHLLALIADITIRLANDDARPQFVRVTEPAPVGGVGGSGGYGPYFGSIPDFTELPNGVRFADVREGSPAAKAGLRAGDVLTEFDGKPIQNLYDFTYALRAHKPGDEVLVKVLREGRTIEAKVLLVKRN
jgi:Peptidase family M28/PDZ domain/PA domain